MSEWIKHDGKSCPVGLKTKVYVKFSSGITDEKDVNGDKIQAWTAEDWGGIDPDGKWFWSYDDPSAMDIVEYRVVTE